MNSLEKVLVLGIAVVIVWAIVQFHVLGNLSITQLQLSKTVYASGEPVTVTSLAVQLPVLFGDDFAAAQCQIANGGNGLYCGQNWAAYQRDATGKYAVYAVLTELGSGANKVVWVHVFDAYEKATTGTQSSGSYQWTLYNMNYSLLDGQARYVFREQGPFSFTPLAPGNYSLKVYYYPVYYLDTTALTTENVVGATVKAWQSVQVPNKQCFADGSCTYSADLPPNYAGFDDCKYAWTSVRTTGVKGYCARAVSVVSTGVLDQEAFFSVTTQEFNATNGSGIPQGGGEPGGIRFDPIILPSGLPSVEGWDVPWWAWVGGLVALVLLAWYWTSRR